MIERRKILIWATPVVTSVVLPAHAKTSDCRLLPETSFAINIDSVTPSTGTLDPGNNQKLTWVVSYTVTNPPSSFSGKLISSLPYDHDSSGGIGLLENVTASSGTVIFEWEYANPQQDIEDNLGAHFSILKVRFQGNSNCLPEGGFSTKTTVFKDAAVDITLNAR